MIWNCSRWLTHFEPERGRFKWSKQRAGGFWWMFLAQKTPPLRDTGTLILVVPSCGLNFVEATRRLSWIEFKVEIKPELLRTSPFYQFYPCRGPLTFFFKWFLHSLGWPGLLLLVICLVAGSVWTLGVLLACSFVASLAPRRRWWVCTLGCCCYSCHCRGTNSIVVKQLDNLCIFKFKWLLFMMIQINLSHTRNYISFIHTCFMRALSFKLG